MRSDNRLFIFDLDDTLVQNQPKYNEAKEAVASYLLDTMEPDAYDTTDQIIDDVMDDEDGERYDAVGVPETRFRDSCIHTAYEIAKEPDVDVSQDAFEATIRFVETQGMKPMFDYSEDDLFDGARDALEYTEEQGDDVVIMTKGTQDAQQVKLDATGLSDFTSYVVDGKDDAAFDEIVGDRDLDSVWKVGNSVRSDAHPMLNYGGNVLLIADKDYTATWVGEEVDNPLPDDGPWFRRDHISAFEDAYDVIEEYDDTGDINVLQSER